jgi:hypothetical protein
VCSLIEASEIKFIEQGKKYFSRKCGEENKFKVLREVQTNL